MNSRFLIILLACCAGCATTGHLPPVDISKPGWVLQQGQALWQPPGPRAEMAGDLIMATNATGDFFVQFSKSPFTVATAEFTGGAWQIQFGAGKFHWSGHGAPPARFSWLELPKALSGEALGKRWKFAQKSDGNWRLEDSRSGESLEGRFFP